MTPRTHGPWTINGSTLKYKHKLLEVYEEQVTRPNGTPGVYATVKIKPGAAVLALDEDGYVYLARQFRYATGRESLEVVAGAIDDGERLEDAARRELREELGIEARELIPLGRVDPMESLIDSPSHLFLARRLQFIEAQQQGSEQIQIVKVSLAEACRLVYVNEITHGSSCVLILRADKFLRDETHAGGEA
ncbi:MAG: NUDIX hydrolase [Acidobacteria bacterium]|nr:MAG: NUDIX hydrolase [Acidobacteriota bacterium]